MEIKKINEEEFECEFVDVSEHIHDLEGIFLDCGESQDAYRLLNIYNKYLGMGFNGEVSNSIPGRKKDLRTYLSKVNGSRTSFRGDLHKKWNSYESRL